MRTEILEKIFKDNCDLRLEKNISIDECIKAISGFYFHNYKIEMKIYLKIFMNIIIIIYIILYLIILKKLLLKKE